MSLSTEYNKLVFLSTLSTTATESPDFCRLTPLADTRTASRKLISATTSRRSPSELGVIVIDIPLACDFHSEHLLFC
jgi:hypothetical protein